jgi:hypothetical protein
MEYLDENTKLTDDDGVHAGGGTGDGYDDEAAAAALGADDELPQIDDEYNADEDKEEEEDAYEDYGDDEDEEDDEGDDEYLDDAGNDVKDGDNAAGDEEDDEFALLKQLEGDDDQYDDGEEEGGGDDDEYNMEGVYDDDEQGKPMAYLPDLPQLDSTFKVPVDGADAAAKTYQEIKAVRGISPADSSHSKDWGYAKMGGMSVLLLGVFFLVRRRGRPGVADHHLYQPAKGSRFEESKGV